MSMTTQNDKRVERRAWRQAHLPARLSLRQVLPPVEYSPFSPVKYSPV
jgi:hypothetical protein